MEFSSIPLQSTSIHMDWDEYMHIQTRPKVFTCIVQWKETYALACSLSTRYFLGIQSITFMLFCSTSVLPLLMTKSGQNIQWTTQSCFYRQDS
jgi:hypothetical protein